MAKLTSDALTNAHMAQVASVRERILAYAMLMWDGADSLRDRDIERLVSRIVPVVRGGQMQVANLTNAYITRLAVLEGVVAEAALVDAEAIAYYRGVDPKEVYTRPAIETYTALAAGQSFEVARKSGRERLRTIVTTDIQQARNRQAQPAYASTGFDYTVRTLSGSENCALCVVASTQRYRIGDLQPVHPGCDCGQRGMRADKDPGQVINRDLLELTHTTIEAKLGDTDRGARNLGRSKADVAGRPLSDFTDLIVTHQHGELGPTLSWRADNFTSKSDIAALN